MQFLKELFSYFMVPPRLCLNKRTFEALKIKNSLFLAIFLRKFILQGPHTQKISLFSLLPHSHMSKLWYDTKIWKKCGPWCEQGMKEQINFFMKKNPIFLLSVTLPVYCIAPTWTYGWFLWLKLVLRHIRKCPRAKIEKKKFGVSSRPMGLFYNGSK